MKDKEIIEITFHGRGGQTLITGSQLLAKMAYEGKFIDVIDIPIIGAERRGAPIRAFTKLSKTKQIRDYGSVSNPDYILVFDTSLLNILEVKKTIKPRVTIIANSTKPINKISDLPKDIKVYIVDATGICINKEFMHSSGPILNIPMLGAFGKITGFYNLEVMEKVLKKEFEENIRQPHNLEKKLKKNIEVAKAAYESVVET